LSQLVIPKISNTENKGNYAKFVAEPLERGFGVTLGNALRRVLLGYLTGAAIKRLKIEGIQHEFSPIPGVKEDTMEFLLNVKAIRIKSLSGQPGKLVLEKQGAGVVSAADINPSTDFVIINPEQLLATIDSAETRLFVEFDVELGTGYHEAEAGDNLQPGFIGVDTIFTPVRKVNYTVEPTHIGRETNYDKLTLEVWTDDTITAVDAMSKSAAMLVEQLSPFAGFVTPSQAKEAVPAAAASIPDEKYNMPVEQLDLSVRTMNCLRHAGITTVGEILSRGEKELMLLRNFGQKSKQEIEDRLKLIGLSLKPEGASVLPEEKVEEK
jgi:DNA-directed RNA polymerase subunit alpha